MAHNSARLRHGEQPRTSLRGLEAVKPYLFGYIGVWKLSNSYFYRILVDKPIDLCYYISTEAMLNTALSFAKYEDVVNS
jgi:hypothetical protein